MIGSAGRKYLEPTEANGANFVRRGIEGCIVMLNLLRFREVADYSDYPELAPDDEISGQQAYELYIDHTTPFLTASGGSIVYLGIGGSYFVGPEDEGWDMVMLIRQASMEDLFSFASNAAYMAGIGHRTAALLDSRMLPLQDFSSR